MIKYKYILRFFDVYEWRFFIMVYTTEEILELFYPVAKKYNVKKAILFGSYARKEAEEKSDIDILVETDLKGLKFYGLLNELSEVFKKDIDLIEVRELKKGSDLEKNILQEGVVLFGRKRQRSFA